MRNVLNVITAVKLIKNNDLEWEEAITHIWVKALYANKLVRKEGKKIRLTEKAVNLLKLKELS
jgi:hypothetical protein